MTTEPDFIKESRAASLKKLRRRQGQIRRLIEKLGGSVSDFDRYLVDILSSYHSEITRRVLGLSGEHVTYTAGEFERIWIHRIVALRLVSQRRGELAEIIASGQNATQKQLVTTKFLLLAVDALWVAIIKHYRRGGLPIPDVSDAEKLVATIERNFADVSSEEAFEIAQSCSFSVYERLGVKPGQVYRRIPVDEVAS